MNICSLAYDTNITERQFIISCLTTNIFLEEQMPKVMPEYKEEVRQKIIRAAYQEAKEKGYQKIRMEDIAGRLGISKGTIYLYFANKNELSQEVIRCIIRRFRAEVARTPDTDLATTIHNIYKNTVHIAIMGGGNPMFDLFSLCARNPEVREMVTLMRTELGGAIASFIRDQQKQGTLDPALDAVRTARMVQAISLGVQNLAATGIEESEIRAIWEEGVFRLLKREPPEGTGGEQE